MAFYEQLGIIIADGGGSGGGSGILPTFSETVLCDNTSLSTGTLTFTDDYDNYDFVLFECYNTSSQKTSYIFTIPELIDHIISISNHVNFNEWSNNQYVCYTPSANHLSWTRYASRNMILKKATGMNCSNATVTKTTFYERANRTIGAVTVEPTEDLADYDYLFFSSTTGGDDETQPCFPPVYVDRNLFEETPEYRGAFFIYNATTYVNTSEVIIGHHSISAGSNNTYDNRYLVGAYGVKFGEREEVNLLKGVTWTDNQAINSYGEIVASTGFRYSDFIPVTEGETYMLIFECVYVENVNTRIHGYNANGVWQSNFKTRNTYDGYNQIFGIEFTIPSGVTQIRISTAMMSYAIAVRGLFISDSPMFIRE